MKPSLIALMIFAVVSAGAIAAGNPFIGTWKINPGKSQVTGRTVTYTKTANGYHFAGGAGEDVDFKMDGKDYPTGDGEMHAWTELGPGLWQSTRKVKGQVIETTRHQLSADGKTLTDSYTASVPGSATATGEVVRSRLAGGPGLTGTWKTTEAKLDPDVTVITEPSTGHLRMETASRKEVIEGPTDGSPFPMITPTVPPGWLASFKYADSRTLEWTGGLKDKTEIRGSNTVSSDGKTMTSVYWFVGKEGEKFTEVNDRQ